MKHLLPRPSLVLCLLCLMPAGTAAVAQTGGLRVQILDAKTREPLPGATVVISSDQQLIPETALRSDGDGRVEFPVLRAGSGYAIEISMPGYGSQRRPALRVSAEQTQTLVVQLTRPMEEVVTVMGSREVVDLEKISHSTKFNDEFINDLPVVDRFYQNLLTLAPGVNDDDGDGNPNVHGGRERDFRAEVGGISNTDPLTGFWLSYVNADTIEELEVVTSGAGVEFGRAQGGFARLIQKQGTNEFEGVVGYLYRSSRLDGDGAANVGDEFTSDFETVHPSFQLSGPIVKDKLWFRLSHEYLRQEDPVNRLGSVAVQTRTQSMNADQLTWQVSPRNKLAFQYQSDPLEIQNLGLSSTVDPEYTQVFESGGDTYTLTWTAPSSPSLLFETVSAWQDSGQAIRPVDPDVTQTCLEFREFYTVFTALNKARCLNATDGTVSGPHNETIDDQRQRFTLRSQATWFTRLWNRSHRFKFGFLVENERYFRRLDRAPDITFIEGRNRPLPTAPLTPTGFATARIFVPEHTEDRATGNNWAIYLEDQLQPVDGLAITLGFRVDHEEIDARGIAPFDPEPEAEEFYSRLEDGQAVFDVTPRVFTAYEGAGSFKEDLGALLGVPPQTIPGRVAGEGWIRTRKFDDVQVRNTNYSPRLAIAWDPWNNGKTKFAVSAGRYYDKIFLAVPLLGLDPVSTTVNFSACPDENDDCGGPEDNGGFVQDEVLGGFNPTLSVHMIDPDLSTPYQDEFTASFERALWTETSIKLTYIKREFRDQLQDIDINHLPGDYGRCGFVNNGQRSIEPSYGSGQTVVDPFTRDPYVDTDPGIGDGRVDDCTGNRVQPSALDPNDPVGRANLLVPDGLSDLYVQNPAWSELLLVGNFNSSDYEAFVVELTRRQYRNWELQASYTWSMAEGDAEDFNLLLGNELNLREDEQGFLDYDQRHVARVNATTVTPWGFRLGGAVRWESGLPYSVTSSQLTVFATPPFYPGWGSALDMRPRLRYPTGQRNDQRNPSFWNFDLRLAKDFRITRKVNFQLTAEVFNLLNDSTLQVDETVNGTNSAVRRFGRQFQIGLRLGF